MAAFQISSAANRHRKDGEYLLHQAEPPNYEAALVEFEAIVRLEPS